MGIEGLINEMEWISKETYYLSSSSTSSFLNCSTITQSTTNEGEGLELVFSNNTSCSDGKIRSGKLELVRTRNLDMFIHVFNYYIDNKRIEGSYVFQRIIEHQSTASKTYYNEWENGSN